MPNGAASKEISVELKINLPHNQAIRLLGICSKDLTSYFTDICINVFFVTLFTIAREGKKN